MKSPSIYWSFLVGMLTVLATCLATALSASDSSSALNATSSRFASPQHQVSEYYCNRITHFVFGLNRNNILGSVVNNINDTLLQYDTDHVHSSTDENSERDDVSSFSRDRFPTPVPGFFSQLHGVRVIQISAGMHTMLLANVTLRSRSASPSENPYKIYAFGPNFKKVAFGIGISNSRETVYDPVEVDTLPQNYSAGIHVVKVVAGMQYSVFLTSEGKVYSAGKNQFGGIGDGTTEDREYPVPVVDTGVLNGVKIVDIGASSHTLAISDQGKIYGWGLNNNGNLGMGPNSHFQYTRPVQMNDGDMGGEHIEKVSVGAYFSIMLARSGRVYVCGSNTYGQLSDGSVKTKISEPKAVKLPSELPATTRFKEVFAGAAHALYLTTDGVLYCAGFNGEGACSMGNIQVSYPIMTKVYLGDANMQPGETITQVSGFAQTIARTSRGRAISTGLNLHGQLGRKTTGEFDTSFKEVDSTWLLEGKRVAQIAGGFQYSVILTEGGEVLTTGSNVGAELGETSTTIQRSTFSDGPSFLLGAHHISQGIKYAQFSGEEGVCYSTEPSLIYGGILTEKFHTMSQGHEHTLLLSPSGDASAVGLNLYGQNGDGTFLTSSRPKSILKSGTFKGKIIQLSAGFYHSLFLTDSGDAFSCGMNVKGALGIGSGEFFFPTPSPVQIRDSSLRGRMVKAVASWASSFFLFDNGQVHSTGFGEVGELGNGKLESIFFPEPIDTSSNQSDLTPHTVIIDVSGGQNHTLFLSEDGDVYATGNGMRGQLGLGDYSMRSSPKKISLQGIINPESDGMIIFIAAGAAHSLLLSSRGIVVAFGDNSDGALGISTFINSPIPVRVNMEQIEWMKEWCKDVNEDTKRRQVVSVTASFRHSTLQLSSHDFRSSVCFGYHESSISVCSSHGKCVSDNQCECDSSYTGSRCNLYACNSLRPTDSGVCYGRGNCTGPNLCVCDSSSGYGGEFCQHAVCFGKTGKNACSGQGNCVSPDICECPLLHWGQECQIPGVIFLIIASMLVSVVFFNVIICSPFIIFYCCIRTERKRRKKVEKQHSYTRSLLEGFQKDQEMEDLDVDASRARLIIKKNMMEIDFRDVQITKKLGSGGSGAIVYMGSWKGLTVAVKAFRTGSLTGEQFFEEFEKEVSMLSSLRHPRVINFFGCSLKPPRIAIIMEYCPDSIAAMIESGRMSQSSVKQRLQFLLGICEGMQYLHDQGVLHRDLKPDNVLLSAENGVKITDFGLAREAGASTSDSGNAMTTQIGTSYYVAPEVMLRNHYDEKCDVFSFGFMMWEICTGTMNPFPGQSNPAQLPFQVANNPSFRPNLDRPEFQEGGQFSFVKLILRSCWDADSSRRPSFTDIRQNLELAGMNLGLRSSE